MKTPATLLGLAIGDALGQPFEFNSAENIIKSGWQGGFEEGVFGFGGMWNLKPGQFTDDTKMGLAIAESLIESDGFDENHLAQKYIEWVESKDLRGIGIQTEKAIHNMMRGIPPLECGKKHVGRPKPSFKMVGKKEEDEGLHGRGDYCGCGTVMRCAPIGLYFADDMYAETRIKAAKKDAVMTHDHPDAKDSSVFMVEMVGGLHYGCNPMKFCKILAAEDDLWEYDHIPTLVKEAIDLASDPNTTFADGIKLGTRGTAHETLASAVFCFLKFNSFKEAVTASVLIGGDTDSRAAITGALAGTYYGLEGIPKEFVEKIEDSKRLQQLDQKLSEGPSWPS
jgi:ADP-ribosyl-[dinitrogen reductase] hydrolase